MSAADRDTLIAAIAARLVVDSSWEVTDLAEAVVDAITAAGYRVVGPAEQAVLDAADAWRTNVVVPKNTGSPLTHSRRLVAAIDALRASAAAPREDETP